MNAVSLARRLRPVLAAAMILVPGAAAAMTVLPLDLPELTEQAARIFVGRVERVETGRDPNGLPATWTTFVVAEPLKGVTATHLTVKQLGARFGDATVPHAALPRYRPGESVVLFVHPESALGFTSPVGLGQGCFRVRALAGASVVENDVGNRNLGTAAGAARTLGGPAAGADLPAALPLATLVGRVRALVAAAP